MSKNREKIWIPEVHRELEKSTVKRVVSQKVHLNAPLGLFTALIELELIDVATGIVKEYYKFPNLITTSGMDGMFTNNIELPLSRFAEMIGTLTIGTGSTAPSPDDLTLDEEVDSTVSNGGISDVTGYQTGSGGGPFDLGNPYHFVKRTRVFVESEANFPALSELGWRNNQSSPEFQFTRALIKNSSGTPITIAKTNQDQLRITYELRMYPPTSQFSGSFILGDSETSHSFTGSAIDIDKTTVGQGWGFTFGGAATQGQFGGFGVWDGAALALDTTAFATASVPQNPTGTVANWGWLGPDNAPTNFSASLFSYESGSFEHSKEAVWEPSKANFGSGGIQGLAIDYVKSGHVLAFYFTPSIKKTDLQRLTFVYTATATASVTSST